MWTYGGSKILRKKASHGVKTRLDYWLISNALHDLVKVTDIIPAIRTDHSAITLKFVNTLADVKGPGVWKINCSLFDDEEFVNIITESIPICLAQGHKEP